MKVTIRKEEQVDLEEILYNTPDNKIAMFEVVAVSPKVNDEALGDHVYIHRHRVYDFMGDECQGPVEEFNLRFISYINR